MPFSCCSSIAQYFRVPKQSIVSRDHSLAGFSFLILFPIPEKSLLLPVIKAFQSSLEQACNCISNDIDWVALLRCMSAVRSVLITFLIHPLSLLVTPSCKCFEVNKWTPFKKIFSQLFRDMMHCFCDELLVLYMKKAKIGEYLCLLKESFYRMNRMIA